MRWFLQCCRWVLAFVRKRKQTSWIGFRHKKTKLEINHSHWDMFVVSEGIFRKRFKDTLKFNCLSCLLHLVQRPASCHFAAITKMSYFLVVIGRTRVTWHQAFSYVPSKAILEFCLKCSHYFLEISRNVKTTIVNKIVIRVSIRT